MYASNYFETAMLNLMRSQSITAPAKMYLALYLSNPGDDNTDGTEISYTGYARQEITFSVPAAEGAGLSMQNTAMISFPESTTSTGSNVTHVAVFDSLIGGNMWLYGQLDTPLNVQAGVSPVFREGSVKWIWSGNFSTYYRTSVMNTLRGTNCSGFTPYIGLCNGDPTGSGSEFSGNSYARIAVTMSAPAQQVNGTALSQNTADVISSVSTGNWGTLNTVAIYDASSDGNAYAVIPLGTSYSIPVGSSVGFHAGDLQMNVN